ncbi:MAG: alpha/beta hydrolase [Gammaproteobacteria bacterium]|nr:alpha/beta hydrolase [Gammaproteobacteria bacterium]
MSSFHIINVWRDPDGAAVSFNPMAHSLLWLPDGHRIGQPRPAFVFLSAWGGYPHDDLAQMLGPALADRGFGFLSLCLRRRGGEGQLISVPDNDKQDVKLAIDYLSINGFSDIYLIGEELGCWSATVYASDVRDPRVKGICLVDPIESASAWLSEAIGRDAYNIKLREAAVAARQGAAMDYRIDCLADDGPQVTMQAGSFLAWWGSESPVDLAAVWQQHHLPTLVFAESEAEMPPVLLANDSQSVSWHFGGRDQLVDLLSEGVWHLNGDPIDNTELELVNIDTEDRSLYGFYWSPPLPTKLDIAVLLMHGLTSSPTSTLFQKMAPVLAQEINVLALESHRSGWSGHETARLDDELADIDGWLEFLAERGVTKVILAGASIGSLSVGRYQSLRQHPNVIGLAHLMPTADCPAWFEAAAGEATYADTVAAAEAAIDSGQADTFLVDVDLRQPEPSLSRSRFRWTQRAASWLSWWGPDADSVNTEHIANARVPVLLLAGTTDSYNDPARFAELREAAVNAPSVDEIWYEDIDHGLAGVEKKTAEDLLAWMHKRGLIAE